MPERLRRGVTLVELMIAIALLAIIVLVVSRTFFAVHSSSLNSRMQIRASRLADMIQTRYSNMYFGYVMPVDSRLQNFGLPAGATYPVYSTQAVPGSSIAGAWNTTVLYSTWLPQTSVYPELPVLNEIRKEVRAAGFSDFVVNVTPMRRDLSATTGMTSSLVPFLDVAPADGIDDVDPGIGFVDYNNDGDTVDFFWINDYFFTSERPNTHIAQLSISLLKKNETVVSKRGQLLTMEALGSGNVRHSPFSEEAAYGIALLNIPSTATVTLFDKHSPNMTIQLSEVTDQNFTGMSGFQGLSFVPFVYPPNVVSVQADSNPGAPTPIQLIGWTEPGATVEVRWNPVGTDPVIDSSQADIFGNFNFPAPVLNNGLVLGWNRFALRAVKGGDISPFIVRKLIKDDRSPLLSNTKPPNNTNSIKTLTPFVQMTFQDQIPQSTTVVSGICPESITLIAHVGSQNWSVKPSDYDPATGRILWVNPVTLLPATLQNGSYEWKVQGGDNAGYKIRSSRQGIYWHFSINVPSTDLTPPTVSPFVATVSGSNVTVDADLDDLQSGVNLNTFTLKLGPNGGPFPVILDGATTPSVGRFFSAINSTSGAHFHYAHPVALTSGPYVVFIDVKNHKAVPITVSTPFTVP
ncbi:MAG: prepilin-type N-terminal cleavage/methylation domain-containing protein [Elusimicrobia bacterium]|nr:prepilin-type N-terminal cleavage/methylation domain-containing protein [Elusimicrobiota bacterium]